MRRNALVAALALAAIVGHAGEAPQETGERGEPPVGERRPPAQEPPAGNGASERAKRSEVALEDATDIVRQAYGGRVVSAAKATARRTAAGPREPGYRVRVDIDGRVKTVFVDMRGRIHENARF